MSNMKIMSIFIIASLVASSLSSSLYEKILNEEDELQQQQQHPDSLEIYESRIARSSNSAAQRFKNAKRVTPDEKLQKMTLAFLKYIQLLKSNQLDSNMRKMVITQLNELVEEIQRHLNDHPVLEHSIVKMLKNPSMISSSASDASDDGKSKDVTPFKWGK